MGTIIVSAAAALFVVLGLLALACERSFRVYEKYSPNSHHRDHDGSLTVLDWDDNQDEIGDIAQCALWGR